VHELETLVGAKKVTVYAPKQPDGFVPVTEHVSTDGTRTVVVRSAGTDIETPHAYIAFVRPADAEGLKPPVPSTGWQPSQDGGSAVMANTAKIAYGHLQDKVTPVAHVAHRHHDREVEGLTLRHRHGLIRRAGGLGGPLGGGSRRRPADA
jgi:hypothetical protein